MSKTLFFIAMLFYFISPSTTYAQQKWYHQWYISQIVSRDDNIKPNIVYQLTNTHIKEVLYYKKRRFGINLSYIDAGNMSNNITFRDQNNDGQLETWESIAIHVKGGGYLKYESRTHGISLVWSTTPVYEWEIMENSDKASKPVQINIKYGLYNRSCNEFLVYGARKGDMINLVWQKEY